MHGYVILQVDLLCQRYLKTDTHALSYNYVVDVITIGELFEMHVALHCLHTISAA